MHRYAIIVDPLSTGREYAGAFRNEGVIPIAVLSTPKPVPVMAGSWHPENFEHVYYFDGDYTPERIDSLAADLAKYDPICIVPGCESAIRLYEALIVRLLPGAGNVPELADARRDKWEMAKAVARTPTRSRPGSPTTACRTPTWWSSHRTVVAPKTFTWCRPAAMPGGRCWPGWPPGSMIWGWSTAGS
jgi:hypothetical protein